MLKLMSRFLIVVFLATFILRFGLAWFSGYVHTVETRNEMVRIAVALATHRGYSDPFVIPTGPTAHEPPLYPLYLGAIYSVFGVGTTAETVKIVIASLVVALRCALLPPFCLTIGLNRRVAIIAGVLSTVYISALQTEVRGSWDVSWQALVLLILIWMTYRIWRDQSWRQRTPWLYSVSWGFAILLAPTFLPILAVLLMCGAAHSPKTERILFLKRSLVTILVVIGFLTPWAVRNQIRLGKPIWGRSNLGLELWISNGPGRDFDMRTNFAVVRHPSADVSEALQVRRLGEVQYNRWKLAEAEMWVRTHPGEFLSLTARRFLAWWFPPFPNVARRVVSLSFSILALSGLVLLFRVQRLAAVLFALVWLSYPLVYYIVQWSSRYRYSMEWQLIVCVAVTLETLFQLTSSFAQKRRLKTVSTAA